MTFTEMSDVLAIIGAVYPRFYANLSANDVKAMTNAWLSFFADDDASLVSDAVKAFIASAPKDSRRLSGKSARS